MTQQDDDDYSVTDKVYLHVKDLDESKYPHLNKKILKQWSWILK